VLTLELVKPEQILYEDISVMIEQSRRDIFINARNETIFLFWKIGQRINNEVLQNKRADYGKQIVVTLSRQLNDKYGRSFAARNLRRMMQFVEQFPDFEIVSSVTTQLTWTHIVELLPLKSLEAKLFYMDEASKGSITVKQLREMISRKAFERKEIANNQITQASSIPFGTFKDPYYHNINKIKTKGSYRMKVA
jgi:hypothetical protein